MSLLSKVRAKHAGIVINATESDTMILVDTETERIYYVLDAANRLRVSSKRLLTPTEISVNKQPVNCVIMLFDGSYYCGIDDRHVSTTFHINNAHKMSHYTACEVLNTLYTHAMQRYGSSFQVITL